MGQFLDHVIATGDQARDLEQTIRRFTDALSLLAGDGLQFHRLLEACARSPEIRGRFVALLQGAIDRVAKAAREGQVSGTVRRDVETDQVGTLLVALALGAISAIETGVPFDAGRARDALLGLLRPD